MHTLDRKWRLLIIHHSHTDIGYTERQEKIEWDHIQFIGQVIDLLKEGYDGDDPSLKAFRWNCESLWVVEAFLKQATEDQISDFKRFVESGNIGISGNYLNSTDLIGAGPLNDQLSSVRTFCGNLGLGYRSAMTADVNGYGWGYSEVLYTNGVRNLLSCVHTHHGMFPLKKVQTPFFWETPEGNRLLVWNGEHYFIGNELGLSEEEIESYIIRDGRNESSMPFSQLSEERIFAYLEQLENESYPFDFLPITVSGIMTDNAPPNPLILEKIIDWNSKFAEQVSLEMVTLDQFFSELRQHTDDIPVYAGDWTDWWADGVGSTPLAVKQFRQAQRSYGFAKKLKEGINHPALDEARYQLNLFAEHTWGYSSSVSHPWKTMVHSLESRKVQSATAADRLTAGVIDAIAEEQGATAIRPGKELRIHCSNPHDHTLSTHSWFGMEHLPKETFSILDTKDGTVIPYQVETVSRGYRIHIHLTLEAGEKKEYRLVTEPGKTTARLINTASTGLDGISDLFDADRDGSTFLENDHFLITCTVPDGIVSIIDKCSGQELIKPDSPHGMWTPIYERTDANRAYREVRRNMGRNRKAVGTRRSIGKTRSIEPVEKGPIYTEAALECELEGTSFCTLRLRLYHFSSEIDCIVEMHKQSVWDPEQIYLSLPVTTGKPEEQFWVDKTGSMLRPRIDQIPGTCIDFYALQHGCSLISGAGSLQILMPDTPLISMGTLDAHPIRRAGDPGVENIDEVYSWVMNNYWETNFKASLGGFHEFRYTLRSSGEHDPENVFKEMEDLSQGLFIFTSYC